jgi:hypothetical protein
MRTTIKALGTRCSSIQCNAFYCSGKLKYALIVRCHDFDDPPGHFSLSTRMFLDQPSVSKK